MDVSEDRGIECRGVCFNYVDGKITLKVYQNLPGITRELAGTTFEKSFSLDEWKDINGYLMGILDRVEGVFDDVIEIPKMTEDDSGDEELADVTKREEGNDGKE